jgi:hypothetical protein
LQALAREELHFRFVGFLGLTATTPAMTSSKDNGRKLAGLALDTL